MIIFVTTDDAPTTPQEARQKTLRFINTPSLWPQYPFLPLTRRKEGETEPELGLLWDAFGATGRTGLSATVFRVNLFEVFFMSLEQFLASPKETFDTAQEIADAGWRVD